MVVVSDVEAASQWFEEVLGLASGHGGVEYEMLMDGSELVAQLHQRAADAHPHLGDPDDPSRGNGVLLWFATDDFDGVLECVERSRTVVLDGPLVNPNSGQREVWLRWPEGYVVVVAGSVKAGHDRRMKALDDFLSTYEAEHGEVTDEEMQAATAERAKRRVAQPPIA